MNELQTIHICDPENCPIGEKCVVGPVPGLACPIKAKFAEYVENQIAVSFKELDKQPIIGLRINLLLKPMLDQLLLLRIEQLKSKNVLVGGKMNPLFKEIRQTTISIDRLISEIYNASSELKKLKKGNALGHLSGRGYHDMLLIDGKASVEETTGPAKQPKDLAVVSH